MTNRNPVQHLLRGLQAVALAACVMGHSSFAATALSSAAVVAVQPTRVADLILLDAGFERGFRQGMVCRLTRGSSEIAEVILVDLRPSCSAALIVSLAAKQTIRAGDVARIKVLKS